MHDNTRKTIWRRIGIILILLPICFWLPALLILVGFVAWTIYEDLKPPQHPFTPPLRTWQDAKPEDGDWLKLFCDRCESPAEEKFLREMVKEYKLKPSDGKLISPDLTLELQVKFSNYRFDFLANGCQIIEIDGATYHSAPEQIERDRVRDEFSIENGYKVLRIPANVVFNSPDEAILRVRAVVSSTPKHEKSQLSKQTYPKKNAVQHFNSLLGGLDSLNRTVEAMRLKQAAMADFKSAISTEQILLDGLVRQAELDQKIDSMSTEEKKAYQEIFDILGAEADNKKLPAEIYQWKNISKPPAVDDKEIQLQIEAEYAHAMKERDARISDMKTRCQNDPKFAKIFIQHLLGAQYPMGYLVKIMSIPQFVEYINHMARSKSSTAAINSVRSELR